MLTNIRKCEKRKLKQTQPWKRCSKEKRELQIVKHNLI